MSTKLTSGARRHSDHFEPQDTDPHEQRRLRGQLEAIDYAAYVANREVIGQANQNPNLSRVFTTFGNDTPQLYLDIDRTVARMLNVPLANVFASVQAELGGTYVNDFNTLGRIYQVRVQGDAPFLLTPPVRGARASRGWSRRSRASGW